MAPDSRSPSRSAFGLWALAAWVLSLALAMQVLMRDVSPSIVQAQLTFSPAAFAAVAHQWTPAHWRSVNAHFALDYVYLVCYGVLGYRLARHLERPARDAAWSPRLLRWMLPTAATFDLIENLLHQAFLRAWPEPLNAALYAAAGGAASAKWALAAIFVAVMAWHFVTRRMVR